MVDRTNHIWRISNLHCISSVAWLTVQTIFGGSVIFTVNPPWHGWRHKAIWWVQRIATTFFKRNSMFSVACGVVSLTLLCGIFKDIVFARYLSCMVHCTDFSLVWGLLMLAPIIICFLTIGTLPFIFIYYDLFLTIGALPCILSIILCTLPCIIIVSWLLALHYVCIRIYYMHFYWHFVMY